MATIPLSRASIRISSFRRQAAISLALLCSFAAAQPVDIDLFNTGVDATGVRLPGGSADTHWQVVAGPGVSDPTSAVVVTNQNPGGNYFQTLDSSWIWVAANGVGAAGAAYTLRLQFDLTGYDIESLTITGIWGADNTASMSLNGASPVGSGTFSLPNVVLASHNTPHSFSITDGFVTGINTLEFQVVDTRNPGGLNVSGLVAQANAIPEPASIVLLVAGLASLAALNRRRRSDARAVYVGEACPSIAARPD